MFRTAAVSCAALLVHHHYHRVHLWPNSIIRKHSFHADAPSRHHLRCIQVGDRCPRNWPEVGDRSRPSGRRVVEHLHKEMTMSVLMYQHKQQYSQLTVPPITDNPTAKGINGRIGAWRAVPLQSGRVDEEAVAVTARRRASCASIDANGLPARVSGVGQCQFHAPALLVSRVVSSSTDGRGLTMGIVFPGRTLEHSSGLQRWMYSSR